MMWTAVSMASSPSFVWSRGPDAPGTLADGVGGCGRPETSAKSAARTPKLDSSITVMLAANNPMAIPIATMPASNSHKGGRNRALGGSSTLPSREVVVPRLNTCNNRTGIANRSLRIAPSRKPGFSWIYRPYVFARSPLGDEAISRAPSRQAMRLLRFARNDGPIYLTNLGFGTLVTDDLPQVFHSDGRQARDDRDDEQKLDGVQKP